MHNNDFIKRIIGASVLLAVGLFATYFVLRDSAQFQVATATTTAPTGTTTPITVPASQYPDYDALKSMKVLALIQNRTDVSKTNKVGDVFTTINVSGKFSRVYLYAEAAVNQKPLTDFDSIYVTIGYKGGHLFRPDSLATPPSDVSTRLLFNTAVVPYLQSGPYSSKRVPNNTDWFSSLFNGDVSSLNINAFLATAQSGKVYLIALYYDCDQTTPDCYIK